MDHSIIFSGFGGQGVLFAGQIVAYAAMNLNLQVTWFPSYGVEMRGGTARCTVRFSDKRIGSPIIGNPEIAVVFNNPSMEKFHDQIQKDGLLVVNSSMVTIPVERNDIKVVKIPAGEMASSQGDMRMTNMIMLGAMLGCREVLDIHSIEQSLFDHMPERKKHLVEPNIHALKLGFGFNECT